MGLIKLCATVGAGASAKKYVFAGVEGFYTGAAATALNIAVATEAEAAEPLYDVNELINAKVLIPLTLFGTNATVNPVRLRRATKKIYAARGTDINASAITNLTFVKSTRLTEAGAPGGTARNVTYNVTEVGFTQRRSVVLG